MTPAAGLVRGIRVAVRRRRTRIVLEQIPDHVEGGIAVLTAGRTVRFRIVIGTVGVGGVLQVLSTDRTGAVQFEPRSDAGFVVDVEARQLPHLLPQHEVLPTNRALQFAVDLLLVHFDDGKRVDCLLGHRRRTCAVHLVQKLSNDGVQALATPRVVAWIAQEQLHVGGRADVHTHTQIDEELLDHVLERHVVLSQVGRGQTCQCPASSRLALAQHNHGPKNFNRTLDELSGPGLSSGIFCPDGLRCGLSCPVLGEMDKVCHPSNCNRAYTLVKHEIKFMCIYCYR